MFNTSVNADSWCEHGITLCSDIEKCVHCGDKKAFKSCLKNCQALTVDLTSICQWQCYRNTHDKVEIKVPCTILTKKLNFGCGFGFGFGFGNYIIKSIVLILTFLPMTSKSPTSALADLGGARPARAPPFAWYPSFWWYFGTYCIK